MFYYHLQVIYTSAFSEMAQITPSSASDKALLSLKTSHTYRIMPPCASKAGSKGPNGKPFNFSTEISSNISERNIFQLSPAISFFNLLSKNFYYHRQVIYTSAFSEMAQITPSSASDKALLSTKARRPT